MLLGLVLAVGAYAGLTPAAVGPGYGDVQPTLEVAAVAGPRLHRNGTDLIITGSVSGLFQTVGMFVGPNEGMKTDRVRPGVDVLSLTKSFDEVRTRIAALANSPNPGVAPVPAATQLADSTVPVTPTAVSAKIALAAVDPSVISAVAANTPALNAIDAAAAPPAMPAAPFPATLSTQLAYAREDAPVTQFPGYPVSKYDTAALNCLAQAVYFEARGESYRGQVAVAQVVMNRVAHPLYPKSICGVVFQDSTHRDGCQFSFACDGRPETINEPQPWKQAQEIAQKVASGELYLPEVANATHYHATYVYPDWAPQLKRVAKIGMHIFYKFRNA
jgi:spore germination cell wall hydrolase CwlJ-like protein